MAKRKTVSLQKKQQRMGYFFIFPLILGILFVFLPNLITTFQFSMNDVQINGSEGYSLSFRGFEYYIIALTRDANFIPYTISAFKDMLINVPVILIFSMLMASILNQKFHGRAVARAIFFIPVLLSTGILSEIEGYIMGNISSAGLSTGGSLDSVLNFNMGEFLASMNFNDFLIGIVESAVSNIYTVLKSSGMQIYIFLAGIQEIPDYLYEAAQIEGCSKWEAFWKITFPMLSPQIAVNLIYTIVDVGQGSRPLYYASTLGNYGQETAMCMIYLAALAVVLLLVFGVLGKLGIISAGESAGAKQ